MWLNGPTNEVREYAVNHGILPQTRSRSPCYGLRNG